MNEVINQRFKGIENLLLQRIEIEKGCSDTSSDQHIRLGNIRNILNNNKMITIDTLKNGCKMLDIDISSNDDRELLFLQIWENVKSIIFSQDYKSTPPLYICTKSCYQPMPKLTDLNLPDICPYCNHAYSEVTIDDYLKNKKSNNNIKKSEKVIIKEDKVEKSINIQNNKLKPVIKEDKVEKSINIQNKNQNNKNTILINQIDNTNILFKNRWSIDTDKDFLDSLELFGNKVPVIVRELENGKFQLISGWRRYFGLIQLNKKEINIEVVNWNDKKCHEESIFVDIYRKSYSPMDLAIKFNVLIKNEFKIDEICSLLGYKRAILYRYKKFLDFPANIQNAIHNKILPATIATLFTENDLLNKENENKLIEIFNKTIEENLSCEDVRSIILDKEVIPEEDNDEAIEDKLKNDEIKSDKKDTKEKDTKEKVGPVRENTGIPLNEGGLPKEISGSVPERKINTKAISPRQTTLNEGQYISKITIYDDGDMDVIDNEEKHVDGMENSGMCYLPILLKALNENYETKLFFANKELGRKFETSLEKVKLFSRKTLHINDYEAKILREDKIKKEKESIEKEYNDHIKRYSDLTGIEFKEGTAPKIEELKKLISDEYKKINNKVKENKETKEVK